MHNHMHLMNVKKEQERQLPRARAKADYLAAVVQTAIAAVRLPLEQYVCRGYLKRCILGLD